MMWMMNILHKGKLFFLGERYALKDLVHDADNKLSKVQENQILWSVCVRGEKEESQRTWQVLTGGESR